MSKLYAFSIIIPYNRTRIGLINIEDCDENKINDILEGMFPTYDQNTLTPIEKLKGHVYNAHIGFYIYFNILAKEYTMLNINLVSQIKNIPLISCDDCTAIIFTNDNTLTNEKINIIENIVKADILASKINICLEKYSNTNDDMYDALKNIDNDIVLVFNRPTLSDMIRLVEKYKMKYTNKKIFSYAISDTDEIFKLNISNKIIIERIIENNKLKGCAIFDKVL